MDSVAVAAQAGEEEAPETGDLYFWSLLAQKGSLEKKFVLRQ